MATTTDRFTFAGRKIRTEVHRPGDGQILFFVDLIHPDAEQEDVSIGWNADGSKFGIYVDGQLVWPIDARFEPPDKETNPT